MPERIRVLLLSLRSFDARQSLTLRDDARSFSLTVRRQKLNNTCGEENMKKTIVAIMAAAFLGGTAVTLTPAPAAAMWPVFLVFVKPDPNFKAVNPYDKKASKRAKHKKKR
jgi:hypothetical protein